MRLGPPRGDSISIELTVSDDLAASVAPGVPAVLTAPALLEVIESAARSLVTPHLDSGEVAVVTNVDVALRSPLPVGATALVTATVASGSSSKLVSEVLLRHAGTLAVRGSVEHRIVDARTLATEISDRLPASA